MLRRLRIENLVLIREAELAFAPGLNAITGETGAGKTILAQAIGLLLGARGDAAYVGPDGTEAYVEAELDPPPGFFEEEELAFLAELRPENEDGLVLARRVFGDGRTRAYAWGRSAAREDLALAGERLIAMSGQFEQRRLARPSYQLDLFDAFAGEHQQRRRAELRLAWRELSAARRRHDELEHGAAAAESRLAELRALVEDTEGLEPDAEETLRTERERLRHVTELAEGVTAAGQALAPDEGDGASGLVAVAERSLAPLERLAPELERAGNELRDAELRLRETASELRAFLASLEAEPDRLEHVESGLERIAETKRRFRCASYEELVARGAEARAELAAVDGGADPLAAGARALAEAEERVGALASELCVARRSAAEPFAAAVAEELRGIGLGEGEFRVELREREPAATGTDEVAFLIRPNAGLPFAPAAETASGGELSRIALAIAAVGGGETMVFDEIDAGIGGQTAHAVGETLRRLAARAQVITITHLPQIATLADRHFRVEKVPGDPTHTTIEPLADEDRREEIRRMLGGDQFISAVQEQ
ncbi:MAG: AAA family ATPase [Actinomycetota bacterium]|nr:AAA family ATPase [Actinomycetota bacterium]